MLNCSFGKNAVHTTKRATVRGIASALLCAVLILFIAPAYAVGYADSLAAKTGKVEIHAGDVVCFGICDDACGFDGKWLVLDTEHTNTGEPGMFLMALNLISDEKGSSLLFRNIGDVSVSFADRGDAFAAEHPGSTDYRNSDIQIWCEDFAQSHLTQAEYGALLPTQKSDAGVAIPGFGIPIPGVSTGTVDFDPVDEILNGDRLFLLSAEEITNPKYGFVDARSRVAQYKGTEEGYWLRSPHIPTFPLDVGFVFSFGAVMDFPVNGNFAFEMNSYARPACNLDNSKITDAEILTVCGEKTIWRLSFQDGEHNDREYDTSLPIVGEVMDLTALLKKALVIIAGVLTLLIVVIVAVIRRVLRKRRAKRMAERKQDERSLSGK